MNEQIFLNGAPAVGLALENRNTTGVGTPPVIAAAGLPWGEIVASSIVSAAAGFALDGIVSAVRKKKRR